MSFKPKRIIVHHSLTKDGSSVTWGAIRKYHTKTLNWSDIGYHAGVELVKSGDEMYYEILMGRMWDVQGAHTFRHNHDSIGLCFVGNFDYYAPSLTQMVVGAKIVSLWLKLFDLTVDDVHGHNEYSDKSCPGKLFSLKDFKVHIA